MVMWDGGAVVGFICRASTGLRKAKGKLRAARWKQQAACAESGRSKVRTLLYLSPKVARALKEKYAARSSLISFKADLLGFFPR